MRSLGKTIWLLFRLILAFVGCLIFQVTIHNWMMSMTNIVPFLLSLVVRPIISVPVGMWLFAMFESELINTIEHICFRITFGYLMFVVPVLGNFIIFTNFT